MNTSIVKPEHYGPGIWSAHLKQLNSIRKSPVKLNSLFRFYDSPGANESGIAITSYGQGQVSGVTYTVPAHGQIEVDFELNILCVTPNDVQTLSALIRSLLDASHQHLYDEISRTDISGGASLFGFFSFGVSASYSDTKHTMDGWGLSETNQQTIVNSMMKIAQQKSQFNYKGTVYNRDYDYDVSGNLFAIVMDATIQQGQFSNQSRFLAPTPHLQSNDGSGVSLPCIGNLY